MVFLENWAYVARPQRPRIFRTVRSGAATRRAVKLVVDEGVELSEAIDAFAGSTVFATRKAPGAY